MGLGIGISASHYDDEDNLCKRRDIEVLPRDNPRELRLMQPGFTAGTQIPIPARKNPNPSNYEIIDYKEFDNFLAIRIRYLDCTNYEGQKILVYQGIKVIDLWNQKTIDPHFSENQEYHSPIARFLPTNEGWQMALKFIIVMEQ